MVAFGGIVPAYFGFSHATTPAVTQLNAIRFISLLVRQTKGIKPMT
jgi:hypothetical protein